MDMKGIRVMLSEHERRIIPEAIEASRDYLTGALGKKARLRDSEAAAFTRLLIEGKEVPAAAIAFACFGLEIMWWKQNRRIIGIPELLARLERLCGYQRTGGEIGNRCY